MSLKVLQSAVLGLATSTSLIRSAATLLETKLVQVISLLACICSSKHQVGHQNIGNNFQFSSFQSTQMLDSTLLSFSTQFPIHHHVIIWCYITRVNKICEIRIQCLVSMLLGEYMMLLFNTKISIMAITKNMLRSSMLLFEALTCSLRALPIL